MFFKWWDGKPQGAHKLISKQVVRYHKNGPDSRLFVDLVVICGSGWNRHCCMEFYPSTDRGMTVHKAWRWELSHKDI